MGMIPHFSCFLVPPVRASGILLPLLREARAELINPDPKACIACLDLTVAGVPLAGPDPLRIPSIVEDGITGGVWGQQSGERCPTGSPACFGRSLIGTSVHNHEI